ncbi:hypothetical protein NSK_007895 [Nannochloropsis salina CCMP1776]|uniref:Uncharacterized protein n=1 Tax=Nannochloropsis salina CCMP1776 TaxID=1027361 RepID=A0A4D9CVQ9_9STRA|nr:hypothetical protein NSK_007895 [Nannochloropsis salina CCMP1776]|eukprot:TFJ80718.1 hypothetical protein NSK_007895 [Nannochloropsis salina CCMP1776]
MLRHLMLTATVAAYNTGCSCLFMGWTKRAAPASSLTRFLTHSRRPSPQPACSATLSSSSAKRQKAKGKMFPDALSTIERMQLLRARAQLEDGDLPVSKAEQHAISDPPSFVHPSEVHSRTILNWVQSMVIDFKLCPWASPALKANAIKIVVAPVSSNLHGLLENVVEEASLLASMSERPEEQNLTTLIGVPGPLLSDFQDFLDLVAVVDECLDELDLRGKVQVASFHPDFAFEDSAGDDVENFTNRSPLPILHLLREVEVSRALGGYLGDPACIYERNKITMKEAGAEQLRAVLTACQRKNSKA